MPTSTVKVCPKCSTEKSLSDFYRNRTSPDGHAAYCVPCWKRFNRENYLKHSETRKEKQRKWNADNAEYARAWRKQYYAAHRTDEAFIAKRNEVARKYQRDNRWSQRVCASKAVFLAIRCGALKRMPCEKCGFEPAQAHHYKGYDLANWFELQWLCHRHHNEVHGRETYE